MHLVRKDDLSVTPTVITAKTAAADCTATAGAPCYFQSPAGRVFVCVFNEILMIIITPSYVVSAYNVTITGSMAVANVDYSIKPKTTNDFTSVVATYTPLKCSAANLAALTATVLAVAAHMSL